MSAPEPVSSLSGRLRPGRFGVAGEAAVVLSERRLAVVQLAARKGASGRGRARLADLLKLSLPDPGRLATEDDTTVVWIAPETWLVLKPWSATDDVVRTLAERCGDQASIVDQSSGKTTLRLSGAPARDVLAKGCRLDLHPRVFAPGNSAVTRIDHFPAVVMQVNATPTFDLMVSSTLAEDFLEWVLISAAEFGCEVGE